MPDPIPESPTVDRRALLDGLLRSLAQAGFVQHANPAEGVISMQRAWQGPDENSAIVDSITIHIRDQALAERQGDGIPTWGPRRGPWSDVVTALLALSPPDGFVLVPAAGAAVAVAELSGGLP